MYLLEIIGIIKASKSTMVLQTEAKKHGAVIKDEIKLIRVEDLKGSVRVTLEKRNIGGTRKDFKVWCKKVIICPGAWLTPSMKSLFNLNVKTDVLQMGYYYFNTLGKDKSIYHASKFPVYIDYSGSKNVYGTPAYEYPSLLKMGAHGDKFESSKTTADTRYNTTLFIKK